MRSRNTIGENGGRHRSFVAKPAHRTVGLRGEGSTQLGAVLTQPANHALPATGRHETRGSPVFRLERMTSPFSQPTPRKSAATRQGGRCMARAWPIARAISRTSSSLQLAQSRRAA